MLNLIASQDLLVSPTGGDVDVFVSYVDWTSGVAAPGNNDGVSIADGAGPTIIVAAPAVGAIRNINGIVIQNKDAASCTIDVTIDDGVNTFTLLSASVVTIPGNSCMVLDDDGIWRVFYANDRISVGYITYSLNPSAVGFGLYVWPTGVRQIKAECVGGGGGGGGCLTAATNSAAAGGGGSGGYGATYFDNGSEDIANFGGPVVFSYSVGAGGAGGVAGATTGAAGGITHFGEYDPGGGYTNVITGVGGDGGVGDTVATIHVGGKGGNGGLGGAITGVDTGTGGNGGTGRALAAAQAVSGSGGNCRFRRSFGSGGLGNKNATSGGANGVGHGAGGAGASIISGGLSQPGGNGAPGLIIITEYWQ